MHLLLLARSCSCLFQICSVYFRENIFQMSLLLGFCKSSDLNEWDSSKCIWQIWCNQQSKFWLGQWNSGLKPDGSSAWFRKEIAVHVSVCFLDLWFNCVRKDRQAGVTTAKDHNQQLSSCCFTAQAPDLTVSYADTLYTSWENVECSLKYIRL